jgi:manganese transport protein
MTSFVAALWHKLPKTSTAPFCPTEVRETVPIPLSASLWQRFRRYAGLGFLVSVGYMDPGNWATDIEAGSHFAYGLLSVVLISSLIAMVLQSLCVRLGMASGKDIAQHCRERFPRRVNLVLWALAQLAVIACDFAEVLGTALALKLLVGLPLSIGIVLTAFDTVIVLLLQGSGQLRMEKLIMGLVLIISGIFLVEILMSRPDWSAVMHGFVPDTQLFKSEGAWLVAIGILGATVMPHNLYLHSSVVGTRKLPPGAASKRDAIRLLTADTLITLSLAFLVNAAILIVSASVFHFSGYQSVSTINEAYELLSPLLGAAAASVLFGIALLAAGQSSTITGTMAGQVILQGFLNLRIPCWQQRFMTRLMAVLPAWLAITLFGETILSKLLVLSQVVLSMQLPFAMIPLILFVRSKAIMGEYRISGSLAVICWFIGAVIIGANLFLLWQIAG